MAETLEGEGTEGQGSVWWTSVVSATGPPSLWLLGTPGTKFTKDRQKALTEHRD